MGQPGFNGVQYILDIATDAAVTQLLAKGPVRFVEVIESVLTAEGVANTLQGFQYQLPNDTTNAAGRPGFTTWFPITTPSAEDGDPADAKLEIGDRQAKYGKFGTLLGNGPDTPGAGQPPIAATVLANLRSATGTATSVIVRQYF
jgi:hypothetical protein